MSIVFYEFEDGAITTDYTEAKNSKKHYIVKYAEYHNASDIPQLCRDTPDIIRTW